MASQVQLSESQQNAVEAPWQGKINLILATAGSGKTLSLTWRAIKIASELVQDGAFNSRILCVCFNKSAADEMAERLLEIIQSKGLFDKVAVTRKAYWPKDMVTIEVRTFHALGYWILRSSSTEERRTIGLRSGRMKLMAAKDVRLLIREALRESGEISSIMSDKAASRYSRACERPINAYKRKLCDWECEQALSPAATRPRPVLIDKKPSPRTYECYLERMSEQNCIDFEDMICKAVKLATAHEQVRSKMRSRYTAVLVDEFQDLTPAEFLLCKVLVEKTKSLTFVGDDDQQIYSFRSSQTWFSHESLRDWFSEELHTLQLPENRRCPGAVVKSAFAVIRRNSRRAEKDIIPVHPDGAPVRIIACRRQGLEISFVIKRVQALLPLIKGTRDQILLLFRTNVLLQLFQGKFKASGIATSRVLTDPGRADTIGPKTSASFALITLMSRKTDRPTFIWAAVTVSPYLERSAVERILETETFAGRAISQPTTSDSATENGNEKRSLEDILSNKPFPSPFLEQLISWYEQEKEKNMDFPMDPSFEALYILLERAEQLMLRLKNVTTTADLVKFAEEIVSSDTAGEFEAYPEMEASQQEFSQSSFDESRAGYELLNSAARKIDEDEDEEDVEAAQAQAKTEAVGKEEDESEGEDFSSLFSSDKQQRSRKRRKSSGGAAFTQESMSQQKTRVGKKIQELCNVLDSTLTKSDKKGGGKISRTERPPTVLSTVHKAKGATFAYVFLCGADTFNFPINGRYEMMESGSMDLQSLMSQEERRMFFVSLTRTQKEFVCTYSILGDLGSPDITGSQSPFLAEMKAEVGNDPGCVTETFVENQNDVQRALSLFQ